MNFSQVERYIDEYRDALVLDSAMSRGMRGTVRKILSVFTLMAVTGVLLLFVYPEIAGGFFVDNQYLVRGFCFMFGSAWLATLLFESMYMSYYFNDGDMDMEVARILEKDEEDVIRGFLESSLGKNTMRRLGVAPGDVEFFLANRKISLPEHAIEIDDELCHEGHIGLECLALSFAHHDKEYAFFLFERGIGESIYEGALKMVSSNRRALMEKERWLTRDHLSTLPSLGRRWAYGQTYYLDMYGLEIEPSEFRPGESALYYDDVVAIERSLVKAREPHATFVSPDPMHGLEIIKLLLRRIRNGKTPSILEDKRLFLINGTLLMEQLQENFEKEFLNLLREAIKAGNTILVFEHASEFSKMLHGRGIELSTLLESAFRANVNIILLTESDSYHETLQTDFLIRNYTDLIMAAPQNDEAILRRLQRDVVRIEKKTGLMFTYQALVHLLKQVKRHTGYETVTDITLDVLYEILTNSTSASYGMITVNEVQQTIEEHFGVPEVMQQDHEKTTLLHLEEILSEFVIGQERALKIVADTLRRVRAGLQRESRPFGSFLMVGPTGVGKTETAKVLARTYFGNEEYLTRLDMSEYNSAGSVQMLLGDRDNTGRLATVVKDHPYGVLLLDEFEKAHPDVHNLFLQILDEGKATDGRGEVINAQQLIIIATSNAGVSILNEEEVVEMEYDEKHKALIRHIVSRRILPPELINRFDHTVLFNSLVEDSIRHVARLQLERLQAKLNERGISFIVTPFAISYLVHKGTSREFGAREIQRVISDTLEAEIAKAILKEDIPKGSQLSFEASETGEEFSLEIKRAGTFR